jgi:hypothetical protein
VSWTQVEDQPARDGVGPIVVNVKTHDGTIKAPSYKTLRLVTWRCDGCKALAVTGGYSPGDCLKKPCRFAKP